MDIDDLFDDPNQEKFDLNNAPKSFIMNDQNFSLGDEQHRAIKGILNWLHNERLTPFKRLSGFGGTGKSVLISYIVANSVEILPSDMKFKSVCVCTYTWKAALVLRSRNVNASSIHSILYNVEIIGKDTVFVRRDPALIREDYCMFIVDEASMVDSTMRADLESVGLPVLYVGDSGQLPAISNDPIDATFMQKAEFRLTEIHRQALDSPIIRLSMDIRNGKFIPYGKYGDGVFKVTASDISDTILQKTDQVLCGKNITRSQLNKRIRRVNGYDINRMPVEGETLIGLNNLPQRFVFNGMQYKTDNDLSEFYLKDSYLTISNLIREDGSKALQRCLFPEDIQLQGFHNESGKSRWLKDNEIHAVDFGYAITVHKSQGSSYKRPVIFEEYLGDKAFHRRWLYTAVTRAVKKVFIVTPNR